MTFLTELARLKSAATKGPWETLPEECDKPYIRIRGTALGDRYKIANVVAPVYDGAHEREAAETHANAELVVLLRNHADAIEALVKEARHVTIDFPVIGTGLADALAALDGAGKEKI